MRTLRLILLVSFSWIIASGCATRRMYSGPHQPSEAVARIKPGAHLRVTSADQQSVPYSSQRNKWLAVLPGEHQIDITSFDYDVRVIKESDNVQYMGQVLLRPEKPATVKFKATAGAKYLVTYSRFKDECAYTVTEKITGKVVGLVTTPLRAIAIRDYYYGPAVQFSWDWWGPPPPFHPMPYGRPPPFHP